MPELDAPVSAEEPAPETAEDTQPQLADDGAGNHDLETRAPEVVKALEAMLRHFGTTCDKFARRQEVIDARRQRFYDRGYQYIYFNAQNFVFVPVIGGVAINVGSEAVNMPRYTAVYNIYKPYRRNFSAPLVQNPPGISFEPIDPSQPLDKKSAEQAEKYAEHWKQSNSQKKLQAKICRLFWTDGRVIAWTRHDEESGEEISDLYGVLEAKCIPITANEQKDVVFLALSDDPEINSAKAKYDWIKDEIKAGPTDTGESAYERNARLGVLQGTRQWAQSADAYAHLVERHIVFIRPAAYEQAEESAKEPLKTLFPDGCQFTFVSGKYAASYNCALDDEIEIAHALDGDGQNRPSWGRDLVPVQDAYNNYSNMRQEYHDFGIPAKWVDPEAVPPDALKEQVSAPGNWHNATHPAWANALGDAFFEEQAVTVPADLIQAQQDLRDAFAQFVSGVQPAMFGGKVSKDDRVGVYAMAREQALGVMALPWGTLQELLAKMVEQAAKAAVKYRPDDQLTIQRPNRRGQMAQPLSLKIGEMGEGQFRAKPTADSSYPETRSGQKQAYTEFMQAAEFNPQLLEAASRPRNLALGKRLQGIDIVIPAEEAENKQLDEIDQLLQEAPVPDEQAFQQAVVAHAAQELMARQSLGASGAPEEAQGMAVPETPTQDQFMKSSVDVDPVYDFHKYHFEAVQDWLNSPERAKEDARGNEVGIQNVRLHGIEHQKLIPTQEPPPMPVMPGKPQAGAAPTPPAGPALS